MLRNLFPRSLAQWLGPLLTIFLLVLLLAMLVIASGILNLRASTPHPEGWADILHATFKRSVQFHADPKSVPADLDSPSMIEKGATYYATACGHCHGAPGVGQSPVALMMMPQPQYLPQVARESAPAELAYIVQHGVKYSGMPAWPAQSRPDEVWPLVAFLRAMPKLSYAAFDRLAYDGSAPGAAKGSTPAFQPPAKLRPFRLYDPIQNSNSETVYIEPAYGFDGQASARDPIANCARCHGTDGRGRTGGRFPNLTLQSSTYLYDALMSFAHGNRKSAYMQVVATQLSDEQLAALARYYGAMAAAPAPQGTPDPALKTEGAQIAAYGIGQKGVGGCTNCHGAEGSARGIPRLEGQSFYYLVDQMRAFRAGGRGVTHGQNPMHAIAHNLNDHQIAAVSAYYAATAPNAKPVDAARQAAAR